MYLILLTGRLPKRKRVPKKTLRLVPIFDQYTGKEPGTVRNDFGTVSDFLYLKFLWQKNSLIHSYIMRCGECMVNRTMYSKVIEEQEGLKILDEHMENWYQCFEKIIKKIKMTVRRKN